LTNFPINNKCTVAVIGLGYVGLPLAIEFSKKKKCYGSNTLADRKIIGFDIKEKRIKELLDGFDRTNQLSKEDLTVNKNIFYTSNKKELVKADVYIVTVPTPINISKRPDLNPLKIACALVGDAIREKYIINRNKDYQSKPIIIFESTVYPGATEEVCIPIIENNSNLKLNKDFFCGYSPERVNPGDKKNTLIKISKLTSGSNAESAEWIDNFYQSIIEAGTFKTKDIKTAEAAKVIENTQRDLNIALVNELAIIFEKLGIDTLEVLEAASTKWNFLNFKPGLVGGHCIGVDPYYLTTKSEEVGYLPEVVLAGRRINDGMSKWIVERIILQMAKKGTLLSETEVLIMGLSFKENCNDLRNTKVIDVINHLKEYSLKPIIFDPVVDNEEAKNIYNIDLLDNLFDNNKKYKVVIVLLSHKYFKEMHINNWKKLVDNDSVIFDLKGIVPIDLNPIRI
tara:strand:+ start:337 stop:1698 length:1362 start_codon:yes stop_codon:yes gene_type:complete